VEVRLSLCLGGKGAARTNHNHYNHSSLHYNRRSVYNTGALEKEDTKVVKGIKVIKKCLKKSDLKLDCVSLALNLMSTEKKKEEHIPIKRVSKEGFDALQAEHRE
jgi:hypothetical protein